MTKDLLIIVPSRGRPDNIARLTAVFAKAQRAQLLVCQDDDDPMYPHMEGEQVIRLRGPRKSYAGWLNEVHACGFSEKYPYIGAFGDDHLPQTEGWDSMICDALEEMGTGFAYANDLHQGERLSTTIFMTTDIPRELGYFNYPHFWQYCDLSWFTLGHAAGCMRYLPDVIIEHLHPAAGKAENDATYVNSFKHYHDDMATCAQYVAHQLGVDAAKIKALRAEVLVGQTG